MMMMLMMIDMLMELMMEMMMLRMMVMMMSVDCKRRPMRHFKGRLQAPLIRGACKRRLMSPF